MFIGTPCRRGNNKCFFFLFISRKCISKCVSHLVRERKVLIFLHIIEFSGRYFYLYSQAEFKEFELRLKFETRLKYDWLHSKLCSMFQDLSRRSIATIFWRISDAAQILKYLTQIVFSISRYFFLKANLFFHFIQF